MTLDQKSLEQLQKEIDLLERTPEEWTEVDGEPFDRDALLQDRREELARRKAEQTTDE